MTIEKRHQKHRLHIDFGGNDSHRTGVVKPVYGIPTFPLTTKAV